MVKRVKKNKEIDDREIINNDNSNKKQNKQIIIILLLMVIAILGILVVPFIIKESNKFSYIGLNFQKNKFNSAIFYAVNIPITDTQKTKIGEYGINFREDPRDLESIKLDIPDKEIIFLRPGKVFISIAADLPQCSDNVVAVSGLAKFLSEFGNLPVKGAISDKTYANSSNMPYITCNNSLNNTVILINPSNETILKRTGKNCYEINYKDCEINKATEKFELIILEKYMDELK